MNNPLISFFAGSIANINPTKDIDIAEFLNQIKYGKYRKETEAITAISDNKERQAAKAKSLPYVTISGTFTKRNTGGLNTHSGLIAVDIDKIETPAELASVKAALVADVYTHSLFTSVSGRGLCVLVRITNKPENHLNHFLWLEKYYDETFGYQIDTACKDITRPRYFSYDPDVYINPNNSKIAGKKAEPKKQPKSVQSVPTDDKIGRIVTELQDGGHNIAESYEDYTTVAFALANGCGEAGRDFFHIVCQMSSKYDPKKCDRKFTNALDTGAGKVGIGTFLFMCKEVGIEINTPEEKRAFAIAKTAKRSNSDIQGAVQQAEALGVDPKLVKEIAESVFADDSIDLKDDKAPIIERIGIFVKMNTTLRRNLVTRNIEDENGKEFDNVILNSIYIKAKSVIGDEVRKSDVDAFIMSDQTKDFHPIKEWRKDHDHLPHKPEIIDELIDLLPFKEPDAKGFVRSWLLGLPATANGDTVRIVLSLIGGQETGKTEWFRKLLPTSLKRYFAESNLMIDKDTDQVMSSRWIVLDDEMGGKSKKDSQKFKELTSKEEFTLREPYGRGQVTLKRLALVVRYNERFSSDQPIRRGTREFYPLKLRSRTTSKPTTKSTRINS